MKIFFGDAPTALAVKEIQAYRTHPIQEIMDYMIKDLTRDQARKAFGLSELQPGARQICEMRSS